MRPCRPDVKKRRKPAIETHIRVLPDRQTLKGCKPGTDGHSRERVDVVAQVSTQVGSELADSAHHGLALQRRSIENTQRAIQPSDSFGSASLPQAPLDRFDPLCDEAMFSRWQLLSSILTVDGIAQHTSGNGSAAKLP
jgi:hypothetical protein